MSYPLTPEQQDVVNGTLQMLRGEVEATGAVKVFAAAGSGKTTTLVRLTEVVIEVYPEIRILYMAYNKEIQRDAERKFSSRNVLTTTFHGFAIKHSGVDGARKIGRRIGYLEAEHYRAIIGKSASDLDVGLTRRGLFNFCNSGDLIPGEDHIPDTFKGVKISTDKKAKVIEYVTQVFQESSPEGIDANIPIPHDCYLKYWQISGSPGLEQYDLVMLDEAQDTNPVLLAALEMAGHSIYVGDSDQTIYQFRQSIDALSIVYGKTYPMSQSFRFGPAVAHLANEILDHKYAPRVMKIKGSPLHDTSIGPIDRNARHARIFRTNRALIREALVLKDRNVPFAIAGNTEDFMKIIQSLWILKTGERVTKITSNKVRKFKTWNDLITAVENDDDSNDLYQGYRILEDFGDRTPEIVEILSDQYKDEDAAKVVLTSAHRSKGREWDQVMIAPDFDEMLDRIKSQGAGWKHKNDWDAEMNLLYVAVTRAMKRLEINCQWIIDTCIPKF